MASTRRSPLYAPARQLYEPRWRWLERNRAPFRWHSDVPVALLGRYGVYPVGQCGGAVPFLAPRLAPVDADLRPLPDPDHHLRTLAQPHGLAQRPLAGHRPARLCHRHYSHTLVGKVLIFDDALLISLSSIALYIDFAFVVLLA